MKEECQADLDKAQAPAFFDCSSARSGNGFLVKTLDWEFVEALPALNAALDALKSLKKGSWMPAEVWRVASVGTFSSRLSTRVPSFRSPQSI